MLLTQSWTQWLFPHWIFRTNQYKWSTTDQTLFTQHTNNERKRCQLGTKSEVINISVTEIKIRLWDFRLLPWQFLVQGMYAVCEAEQWSCAYFFLLILNNQCLGFVSTPQLFFLYWQEPQQCLCAKVEHQVTFFWISSPSRVIPQINFI